MIITACANNPLGGNIEFAKRYPAIAKNRDEVVNSFREAYEAGATVAHLHPPVIYDTPDGIPKVDLEGWKEIAREIRKQCDGMIIQLGVAGAGSKERMALFSSQDAPNMVSICLTEHDYNFDGVELNIMHPRAELEKYAELCLKTNVKPEFEIFHLGAMFNLKWLENKGFVKKPYWFTLFFGSKGGVWTPPSMDELMHRTKNLPPDVVFQTSVWCGVRGTASTTDQINLLTAAMTLGSHIRIGTEDNPEYSDGVPAESNAQLVDRIAKVAKDMGRGVATPEEARNMIKLPR